ncbi:MAG: hypothetical protein GXO79_12945 [Chlorobi bacterium]|nr:hypothetical protein [Chlorobiota bacterium]
MKKLKASTIIETIVAMTIIMISFGIVALLIINNAKNNSQLKLNAYLLTEDIKAVTKAEKEYNNEEYEFENLLIYKSIEEYENFSNIKVLHLEVFSINDKLIYDSKELINLDNEKD